MTTALDAVAQDEAGNLRSVLFGANADLTWHWIQRQRQELVRTVEAISLRERLPYFATGGDESLERAGKPFEVFIVGSVKFGKSTLINALLGQLIAPTGRYPKTWCFNRYIAVESPKPYARLLVEPRQYAATPHLHARLGQPRESEGDLSVFHLSFDDVERLMEEEEERTRDSLKTANPYVSPIIEIEWQVQDSNAVLKGMRLVDTMGLNGIREKKGHLNRLTWQFRRADAVIWVVSATNLNDAGIREQLREFRRFAKRSVLVVNRWDEVTNKEAVSQKALDLYQPHVNEVVFLSALAAEVAINRVSLKELSGEQRAAVLKLLRSNGAIDYDALLKASGFPLLKRVLESRLQAQQREIRVEAAYNRLRTEQADCRRMARTLVEELRSNLGQLHGLRTCLHEGVAEAASLIQDEVDKCVAELEQQIDKDLRRLTYERLSSPETVLDLQGYQNRLRATQQRLTEEVENIFARLRNRASAYVKVEFATDGAVAEELAFPSLGAIQLKIDLVNLGVVLPHLDKGKANQVWDFLGSIPLLGGLFSFLDDLFGGSGRRRRKVEEARDLVRSAAFPEVRRAGDSLEEVLLSEVERLEHLAHGDIEACASKYGREEEIRARLQRLNAYLGSPEPPPLWVELTLNALRQYRWRRK